MPLGNLFVAVRATADEWSADVRQIQREAKALENSLKPLTKAAKDIGTALAAAGTAITATFAVAVKNAADFGDAINDASKRTGATTEALSKLKLAADTSGTSFEGLTTGLKFLGKNMEAATSGSKAQIAAFRAAGISAQDLVDAHGDVNVILNKIADTFAHAQDGAGKTAIAMALLGRSGTDLIPMLNEGSAGLKHWGDEAERTGRVISKEAAAAADEFNDQLTLLQGSIAGLSGAIGGALIPPLTGVVKALTNVVSAFRVWTAEHPVLIKAIAGIGLALTGAGGLLLGLSGLLFVLPQVTVAFTLLTGPIGLVIGAFAALGVAMAVFPRFRDVVLTVVKQVSQAIVALGSYLGSLASALVSVAAGNFRQAWATISNTITRAGDDAIAAGDLFDRGVNAIASIANIATPAVSNLGDAAQTTGVQLGLATNGADAFADAVEQMLKPILAAKDSPRILAAALQELERRQIPVSDVMKVLGKDIAAMRISLIGQTGAVADTISKWDDWRRSLEAADAEAKIAVDTMTEMNKAFGDQDAALRAANVAWANYQEWVRANANDVHLLGLELERVASLAERALRTSNLPLTKTPQELPEAPTLPPIDIGPSLATLDRYRELGQQAIDSLTHSAGKMFDDMIIGGKNVWTSFGNFAQGIFGTLGRSLFQTMVHTFLKPFQDALGSIIASIQQKIAGSAISGLLSKGLGAIGLGALGVGTAAASGIGTGVAFGGAGAAFGGTAGAAGLTAVMPGTMIGGGAAAGGAAAGGLTGALGLSGGAGLFGLGAATIPVIGGALVGIGLAIKHFISDAHKYATQFVNEVQNPFGAALAQVVDANDAAIASGQASYASVKGTYDSVTKSWADFKTAGEQFAAQGSKQAKVFSQALDTLNPIVAGILDKLHAQMDAAWARDVEGRVVATMGKVKPQGQALNEFQENADILDEAIRRLTANGSSAAAIIAGLGGDIDSMAAALQLAHLPIPSYIQGILDAAKAQQHAAEVASAAQSIFEKVIPATPTGLEALHNGIMNLSLAGVSSADIVKGLSTDIHAAAESFRKVGQEVPHWLVVWDDLATTMESATAATEKHTTAVQGWIDRVTGAADGWQDLETALQQMMQSGTSTSTILNFIGGDIERFGDAMRQLGIEMPAAIASLYAMAKAASVNAEIASLEARTQRYALQKALDDAKKTASKITETVTETITGINEAGHRFTQVTMRTRDFESGGTGVSAAQKALDDFDKAQAEKANTTDLNRLNALYKERDYLNSLNKSSTDASASVDRMRQSIDAMAQSAEQWSYFGKGPMPAVSTAEGRPASMTTGDQTSATYSAATTTGATPQGYAWVMKPNTQKAQAANLAYQQATAEASRVADDFAAGKASLKDLDIANAKTDSALANYLDGTKAVPTLVPVADQGGVATKRGLIMVDKGELMTPAPMQKQLGGTTVVVNIDGNVIGNRDFLQTMIKEIQRAVERESVRFISTGTKA